MDKNSIKDNINLAVSVNGKVGSSIVTTALLCKNLLAHYKVLKEEKKKYSLSSPEYVQNPIASPYLSLLLTMSYHPELFDVDAIVQENEKITYGELLLQCESLACFFQKDLKVQPNENISVISDNSISGLVSFFAGNALNARNCRIFSESPDDEFLKAVNNFQSTTILADEKNLELISKNVEKTNIKNVVMISETKEELIEDFKSKHPTVNIYTWNEAINKHIDNPIYEYQEVRANDIAGVYYTSGSSGNAKPISFPNRSFVEMEKSVRETTNEKIADGEHVVGTVSFEYPYAINNSSIMILLLGKTLILPSKNETLTDSFKKGIDKIQSVPNYLSSIEEEVKTTENKEFLDEIKKLGILVTGGQVYRENEKKSLIKVLASRKSHPIIIDGIGFGEMGSAVALKFGLSKYFLLMNGFEAKVIDENTREVIKNGEGLLCVTGPTVTAGYYNMPEKTEESFVKGEDGRIWFITDTYASIHGPANRLIELKGRKKEYFITKTPEMSGFAKIYSADIENFILGSNLIKDCIVVASDNSATPTPVVYYSLYDNTNYSIEEIEEYLRTYCFGLKPIERPTEFIFEPDGIKQTRAEKKNYKYYNGLRQNDEQIKKR